MLNDCAWREVNKLWTEKLTDRPKLCELKELVGRRFKPRCWGEEEEDEKSADETERKYSRATGEDGEMERFEEGRQEVC